MKLGPVDSGPVNLATGASLPEIKEIQRWAVRPGDRLIVRVDHKISHQQAEQIQVVVRHSLELPADFPILVTGPDVNMEVAESDVE